jgi:hypothetical protein
MKVEQIIDEMQASLTKLRGHFRSRGTDCCYVCAEPAVCGTTQRFCEKHKTAGMIEEELIKSREDALNRKPDLSLNVRVAKALGKEIYQDGLEEWREYCNEEHIFGPIISDYPNDLVATMGALEEYCRKSNLVSEISMTPYGGEMDTAYWYIALTNLWAEGHDELRGLKVPQGLSLPQAICEAIVAHAEVE